jgi:transcriptional regulator with XRE-family HTH domain
MKTAPPQDSFAGWLRQVMTAEGLSQEGAARRVGVSLRTLHRWFWGETEPRYSELKKVKEAFGALPPELMRM